MYLLPDHTIMQLQKDQILFLQLLMLSHKPWKIRINKVYLWWISKVQPVTQKCSWKMIDCFWTMEIELFLPFAKIS